VTVIRIPYATPDMSAAAVHGDGTPYPFEVAYEGWRIWADSAEEILNVVAEGYSEQPEQSRKNTRLRIAIAAQAMTQHLLNAGELFDHCTEEEAQTLLCDPGVPLVVEKWRCGIPLVLVTCYYKPLGDLPQPVVTPPGQIWWIDPSTDQSLLETLNGVRWLDLKADMRTSQTSRNPAYADPPAEGSAMYQWRTRLTASYHQDPCATARTPSKGTSGSHLRPTSAAEGRKTRTCKPTKRDATQ
jgi:hypothetical protein